MICQCLEERFASYFRLVELENEEVVFILCAQLYKRNGETVGGHGNGPLRESGFS